MTDLERFNDLWMPEPNSGCWLWLGTVFGGNARPSQLKGRFQMGGRSWLASRASYVLNKGPIPVGALVCHKCDIPTCVNPAHLWLGTHTDNNRDKAAKGRCGTPKGQIRSDAKLTDELVREIRRSTIPHRTLARQLGVNDKTIRTVRSGESWGHVQ